MELKPFIWKSKHHGAYAALGVELKSLSTYKDVRSYKRQHPLPKKDSSEVNLYF